MRKIGIDVGGTFTDVVLIDESTGRLWSTKVPTTPADPSQGAADGVARILALAGMQGGAIDFVGHGTTIATNMVIEGKGAKVGLLTTEGFRDILEIRRSSRHDRADLYDLFFTHPPQLVPRRLRLGVNERVLHDGTVARALDVAQLRAQLDRIVAEGGEAIAVCFLNAHVNPVHEQAAVEEIRRARGGTFVSASYDVNPEMHEYERTCTTVINAMLGPRVGGYIRTFESKARAAGIVGDLYFMQSNGGLARPAAVADRPVTLLESGPAGGVTAAAGLCESLDIANAITGDMGGTSFDVAVIRNGRPEIRNSTLLHSHAVRVPSIDIESIGAGGGSIAWIDAGGGLRIGPMSAGADPGPACYGRGGQEPTVTDCNLVLGYLDREHFLGGEFKLDVDAAWRAVETKVAKPLAMTVEAAAEAVRAVANGLMAQAIRLVTIERGHDPRDFAFIPFGGAGPVHAVDLARALEIPKILVPPLPGLFSAFGMLVADLLYDFQAAVLTNVEELAPTTLEAGFAGLERRARVTMDAAGVPPERYTLQRRADCAYLSQAETLAVEVPSTALTRDLLDRIGHDFTAQHQRQWHFVQQDRPVVVVNIRVRAVGRIGSSGARGTHSAGPGKVLPAGEANILMQGVRRAIPRYTRSDLLVGAEIAGPAVIDEASSSIVIGDRDQARIGPERVLMVDVGRDA